MRRGLMWALCATVVLSGLAMSMDDKSARIVAAIDRAALPQPQAMPQRAAHQATPISLPHSIEPVTLEAAQRDIFAAAHPPAPPPPPSPPAFVGPPPPPPPPAPPPVNWRYLGSMTTPAGERLVMLARGETAATLIQPGARLEDGYVVESIRPDGVRLVYPSLGSAVDLPIPPVPPSAIR